MTVCPAFLANLIQFPKYEILIPQLREVWHNRASAQLYHLSYKPHNDIIAFSCEVPNPIHIPSTAFDWNPIQICLI